MRRLFDGRARALVGFILGLVVATAATAGAASLITSTQIKNGTIQLKDLSVSTKKALRGARGARGPQGKSGPQGSKGESGTPGAKGDKGDPGTPGAKGDKGDPGTSLFNASTIPSGVTVRGAWGGRYIAAIGPAGTQQNSYLLSYSFPLPAPQNLADADVQFGAGTVAPVGDADPACTGNVANPTAPAGKVCLYVEEATRSNATLTGFKLRAAAGTTTAADSYGFEVRIVDGGTVPATMRAEGTWAYTAP